jgi:hypothetical protein
MDNNMRLIITKKTFLQIELENEKFIFEKNKLLDKIWYNIVVTHRKVKLNQSIISLYIDGQLDDSKNSNYFLNKVNNINIINNPNKLNQILLGPFFLYDDVLTDEQIYSVYINGSNYKGSFANNSLKMKNNLNRSIVNNNYSRLIINQILIYKFQNNLLSENNLLEDELIKKLKNIENCYLSYQKLVLYYNIESLKDEEKKSNTKLINNTIVSMNEFTNPNNLIFNNEERNICKPILLSDEFLKINGITIILNLIECSFDSKYIEATLDILVHLLRNIDIVVEMERIGGFQKLKLFFKNMNLNSEILSKIWRLFLDEGII